LKIPAHERGWVAVAEATLVTIMVKSACARRRYAAKLSHHRTETKDELMGSLSVARELWEFLKVRKKFWLAPIILLLLMLGALIVFTESSALAPFIYALF